MTPTKKTFTNCGWARPSVKDPEAFFCKKTRRTLSEADIGTGICPCWAWIQRAELKIVGKGKKQPEKAVKLFE